MHIALLTAAGAAVAAAIGVTLLLARHTRPHAHLREDTPAVAAVGP